MKKHIANIVTGFRMTFSILLAFLPVSSAEFFAVYLLCGLSDIADGTIARKTGGASEFGARFDTVADFAFTAISLYKLLPQIALPRWLWIWIGVIALIKAFNAALGFLRRRHPVFPHTLLNKASGFCLFLLPLTLSFIEPAYSFSAVCLMTTAAAVHEAHYIRTGCERA